MATAQAESTSKIANVITTCVVCTETYTDPRLLYCGHHFCLPCLEKIASGHPDGHVICPTCRHLTDVTDVSNLTKYKVKEFQSKVNDFLQNPRDKVEKKCSLCNENAAKRSCFQCRIIFCDSCKKKHDVAENFGGHKVTPISSHQFCKQHPDNFVLCLCKDCYTGCCFLDAHEHNEHEVISMDDAGYEARYGIKETLGDDTGITKDKLIADNLKGSLEHFQNVREEFHKMIGTIRSQAKELLQKLDNIEDRTEEEMKAEKQNLDMMKFDLAEFIETKGKAKDFLTDLKDNASDAEVVFELQEFPKFESSRAVDCVNLSDYKIPDLSNLANLTQHLAEFITQAENDTALNLVKKEFFAKEIHQSIPPALKPKCASDDVQPERNPPDPMPGLVAQTRQLTCSINSRARLKAVRKIRK